MADLSHHDAFPQTRWSLVLAVQGEDEADARAQGALSELRSIYWPPIDAFDSEPKLVSLDDAPVTVSVIHPTTLEEHLGLIYKRRKDASNLSYSFELSSGLAAWTAAGSGDLEVNQRDRQRGRHRDRDRARHEPGYRLRATFYPVEDRANLGVVTLAGFSIAVLASATDGGCIWCN